MQVVGRRTLTCDFSRSGSHYVDWLVCIYTYCHPFVFAVEHHFCSSRASFFVLYDRLLRVSARPVKNDWLHWYVKADFIFRWWQRECSTEQRPRAWATSHFLPTQFYSLDSRHLYGLSQRGAVRGIPTLCLALGVLHLRHTFFMNTGFIKGWFSGNIWNKVLYGKKETQWNILFGLCNLKHIKAQKSKDNVFTLILNNCLEELKAVLFNQVGFTATPSSSNSIALSAGSFVKFAYKGTDSIYLWHRGTSESCSKILLQ